MPKLRRLKSTVDLGQMTDAEVLDALPDMFREVEFQPDGHPKGDIVGIVAYADAEIRNHGIKGFVNSHEWDAAWAAGLFLEVGAVDQAAWIERGLSMPKLTTGTGFERYSLESLEEMDELAHLYIARKEEVTAKLAEYVRANQEKYW